MTAARQAGPSLYLWPGAIRAIGNILVIPGRHIHVDDLDEADEHARSVTAAAAHLRGDPPAREPADARLVRARLAVQRWRAELDGRALGARLPGSHTELAFADRALAEIELLLAGHPTTETLET